jgi:hypothetical protein
VHLHSEGDLEISCKQEMGSCDSALEDLTPRSKVNRCCRVCKKSLEANPDFFHSCCGKRYVNPSHMPVQPQGAQIPSTLNLKNKLLN